MGWGRGGMSEINVSEPREKTYLRNKLKLTYHYIYSYCHTTLLGYSFRLKVLMFIERDYIHNNVFVSKYNRRAYIRGGLMTELC